MAENKRSQQQSARRVRPITARERAELNPPIRRRPPAKVPAPERWRRGLAPRGKASTLTPTVARTILEMRAAGHTIAAVAEELGHPPATISHWISTGRAKAVAAAKD